MRTMIPQTCHHCQKVFEAVEAEVKRGNAKFCSRVCSGLGRVKKPPKDANQICAWCQIPIYRKKISKSGLYFCSKQHQSLAFASSDIELAPGPKRPKGYDSKYHPCLDCSKLTTKDRCPPCVKTWKIQQWLSGNNESTWMGEGKETAHWVKQYIISIRGDKCEVCGFNELHPVYQCSIIQMDHIDGNSLNNDPSNLKLLCPNHHVMTTTYGSRNKNSGRRSRRIDSIMEKLKV